MKHEAAKETEPMKILKDLFYDSSFGKVLIRRLIYIKSFINRHLENMDDCHCLPINIRIKVIR